MNDVIILSLEVHQLSFILGHYLLSSIKKFLSFLVIRYRAEVCLLSHGLMLLLLVQVLSLPLQSNIRFLRIPLPAAPWASLAASFPTQESYGLTSFRVNNLMSGLGTTYTPAVV